MGKVYTSRSFCVATPTISYLLGLLLLLPALGWAQHRGHYGQYGGRHGAKTVLGSIKGTVIDRQTGAPLEYVSIVVSRKDDSTQVDGTLSDAHGKFSMLEIPVGNYLVLFSYLGYNDTTIEVQLTRKDPDAKLQVLLSPSQLVLKEVKVKGQRALIEQSVDKISYNVEKDATLIGGDGVDVLRKVPLVSVDHNGNVSLGGASNVLILVNGKPSSLFSNDPGNALKMIPAEQIKRVEVITSPGAKYDAEGTGGIINIITKRKGLEGISGRINGRAGYPQNRLSLTLNSAKGRLGGNLVGSAVYSIPRWGSTSTVRITPYQGQEEYYHQIGDFKGNFFGYWGRGEGIYEIDGYSTLGTSLSWGAHTHSMYRETEVFYTNPALDTIENFWRTVDGYNERGRYNWTLDYIKNFDQKDRQFSAAVGVEYIRKVNTSDLDQKAKEFMAPNPPAYQYEKLQDNLGHNVEITVQSDYTHPINEQLKAEAGVKTIQRIIRSDFTTQYRDAETPGKDFILLDDQSDVFHYRQSVYAAYLSGTWKWSKDWSLITGLRWENTGIEGYFRDFEGSFKHGYDVWIPHVAIARKFGWAQTIKLSYNKRIRRPSLTHINPFVDVSDERNIRYGNPELKPVIAHRGELSYNIFMMGSSMVLKAFYQRTNDEIGPYTYVDSVGISHRSYYNLGARNELGLNLFIGIHLGPKFSLNLNGHVRRVEIIARQGQARGLTNVGYQAGGFGNLQMDLPHDLKFEIMVFGRSPRVTVQGFEASFWMTSFSLQKYLWNKKATLGISVIDPFWARKVFRTRLENPGFFLESINEIPFRSVGLQFSYKFGKLKYGPKKYRTRIKNEDLLKGEDNGEGAAGSDR